jgi:TPR repeat protein
LDGIDVAVDYKEAFRLLTGAANRGAARAAANLARIYAEGLGIPKDIAKAIRLYEQAAKAGEFLAQVELGRIYSRGLGVPTNPKAALIWYSDAAVQEGRVDACEELKEAKAYVAGAT